MNLFLRSAKMLHKGLNASVVGQNGAKLIKVLEHLCGSDKAMANLKGKIKEIKSLC